MAKSNISAPAAEILVAPNTIVVERINMTRHRAVCKVSEVPEGEARMFQVDERRIAVFRIKGDFFAIDDRCPHAGASLACGFVENHVVSCRIHHWRFCIKDGVYLDENNDAFNVSSYTVRVIGDDVWVEL